MQVLILMQAEDPAMLTVKWNATLPKTVLKSLSRPVRLSKCQQQPGEPSKGSCKNDLSLDARPFEVIRALRGQKGLYLYCITIAEMV